MSPMRLREPHDLCKVYLMEGKFRVVSAISPWSGIIAPRAFQILL